MLILYLEPQNKKSASESLRSRFLRIMWISYLVPMVEAVWAPVLYRGIPLEAQKANTPMTPQQPSSSLLPKPRTSRIITSEIPK